MNQGNRAFTNFKRPAKELIERFRDIPLANIADNMGRTPCIDQQIKNYGASNRLLGTAFTVKVPAGDNLLFHMALDMIQPGDVLVIDGNGCMERSQCGEIMTTYAYKKGCVGIVVDGVIRDVAGVRSVPIPVYARGVQANGPLKNGLGELLVPVPIGGVTIYPGDIIIGDDDGVLAVRPQDAEEVAAKAQKTLEMETKLLEQIRATGEWNRKVFWDSIEKSGVQRIDGTWEDYFC